MTAVPPTLRRHRAAPGDHIRRIALDDERDGAARTRATRWRSSPGHAGVRSAPRPTHAFARESGVHNKAPLALAPDEMRACAGARASPAPLLHLWTSTAPRLLGGACSVVSHLARAVRAPGHAIGLDSRTSPGTVALSARRRG